jgi:N-acyl-D-aspartate/D-glutamate deacylase
LPRGGGAGKLAPGGRAVACDLKLVGATLVDGSGAPARRADVALSGDAISHVGELSSLEAARTLDCTGRVVAPGFIDIHSHADWLLPGRGCGVLVEPFVRQGMTTLVGGNCGFSPAPLSARSRAAVSDSSVLITDEPLEPAWDDMGGFLDALAAGGVPLNLVELVGHGTLRASVLGPLEPRAPRDDERVAMERLARAALDAGAAGVSTGLGYAPGIFAGEDELACVAGWAARAGKLFTSHARAYSRVSPVYPGDAGETPHNLRALREVMIAARRAGARVQLSHLIFVGTHTWRTCEQVLAEIERERAAGLDVAFDAFPYTAGNTTASVLFPPELLPHLEAILADPEALSGIRVLAKQVFAAIGFGLDEIQLMTANAPGFEAHEGLFVPEAAARMELDPFEYYARLVIASRRNARVLIHHYSGRAGEEDALRAVLAHPLCTFETDTFLTRRGHQNPASYGAFARAIGDGVAAGLYGLEEAVRKATGAAAERLGLRDRGLVRRGLAADLVVFDPARLRDRASFEDPARSPSGIDHVFVNGRHVLDGDRYDATALAGRVLRT